MTQPSGFDCPAKHSVPLSPNVAVLGVVSLLMGMSSG